MGGTCPIGGGDCPTALARPPPAAEPVASSSSFSVRAFRDDKEVSSSTPREGDEGKADYRAIGIVSGSARKAEAEAKKEAETKAKVRAEVEAEFRVAATATAKAAVKAPARAAISVPSQVHILAKI